MFKQLTVYSLPRDLFIKTLAKRKSAVYDVVLES